MAKKVIGMIKLQIPAGKATPAPPVGPALGQHGVNIMDFCKAFNATEPNKTKVASVTSKQVEEIAKTKLPDLNTSDLEQAKSIVLGTARSMGLELKD
ncbi:MAG: hypothetical protein P8Z74_05625 [Acidobacteriota bacterium]